MNTTKTRHAPAPALRAMIGAAAILALAADAGASILWTVTFDSPTTALAPAQSGLVSNLLAAADDWSQYFTVGTASIDVLVHIDPSTPRASGRSVTSSFLYNNGTINVWEQGAAAEIRTGVDPNGAAPDVELTIGQNYLQSSVWWDPDPTARTAPVPFNLYDGYSVLLHEIGHALAFNGWRNPYTGALETYGSNFDELTSFDGANFFFNGPNATRVYAGPVPLTYGNIFHLGNFAGRPGTDLVPDLMNGVTFYRGWRYHISRLDLAILADLGLPARIPDVPTPASIALAAVAISLTTPRRRRA